MFGTSQLDYYRSLYCSDRLTAADRRWRELSGLDGTDADSQRDLATSSEGRRKLGYPATVAPDVDLMDATQWARLGHWRKLGTRRLQDRPITQVCRYAGIYIDQSRRCTGRRNTASTL